MIRTVSSKRYRKMFYPQFIRKTFTSRTLAILIPIHKIGSLSILDHDGVIYDFRTFDELKSILFENNLLLVVSDLKTFPILKDLINNGTVGCTESGVPIFAFIRGGDTGNSTRWIVTSKMWDTKVADKELLKNLYDLYEYCGVGTPPTKSSLANAIYESVLYNAYGKDWYKHRHERPTHHVSRRIEYMSKGAIIETNVPDGTRVKTVDVLDGTNSYAFAVKYGLPTGKHSYFLFGETEGYAWYIANDVKISKGNYSETMEHLASSEIEYFRSRGYTVEFQRGMGWYEITHDADQFVDRMEYLRNNAPSEWVKKQIKGVIVAWTGSKGQKSNRTMLVGESTNDNDIPLNNVGDSLEILPYFVKLVYNPNPHNMPHWYYAIIAQSRVNTMIMQEEFITNNTLLATDTDCIYVTPSKLSEQYDTKGSRQFKTGEITRTRIYDVVFEKNRWMSWYDENGNFHTKRPGEPLANRTDHREPMPVLSIERRTDNERTRTRRTNIEDFLCNRMEERLHGLSRVNLSTGEEWREVL